MGQYQIRHGLSAAGRGDIGEARVPRSVRGASDAVSANQQIVYLAIRHSAAGKAQCGLAFRRGLNGIAFLQEQPREFIMTVARVGICLQRLLAMNTRKRSIQLQKR